jgi:putative peptidoglycan lipid II flippase
MWAFCGPGPLGWGLIRRVSQVGVEPRAPKAIAIGKAGGIMVASMFVSRLLGLLRDTFIVSHFGLGNSSDSFAIAARIPDLIFMLIAGGGLSSAFIPVFTEFWYTDRRKEAWKVFSVVVTICSLIAVALIALAWALAPAIVPLFGRHKTQGVIDMAILMSRIMLPAQFAFLIGSVLLGTLYARKQFVAPGLAPNVYNIGIIVGASILPTFFGFGIAGVAWGALFGAFIGNILIPLLVMIPQGIGFAPSFDVRAPGVKAFFKLLLPVIVGFSLPSMVTLISQYFASPYGEGSNIGLQCANNLMQAPLGIFGQSLALAVFPVLGQFYAEKRMDLYRSQFSKTLRTVLYLTIPVSVLMFMFAPLLVKIIYGFGKAAHDTAHLDLIANCLRIYCVAIPAWCAQPVLMRGFFSLHKTFKPIAWGTAMTVLFIAVSAAVQATQFGPGAIPWTRALGIYALPWATNLAAILLVIILYVGLEGDVGKLDRIGLTRTVAKGTVSSVPLGLIAFLGAELYSPNGKLLSIAWFLLFACLAAWAYYFVTSWFKMPETAYLDKALVRAKLKRS